MMLFLDEVGALAKIREIMRYAEQAKIAVAFWGQGAIQAMGLDRLNLDAEIICNLDSGACNPSEIEKLLRLRPNIPIRSDPRLHGKLYWTPAGIVIGSSNASTNGLAIEDGLDGWAEANVFSDDSRLIEAALLWFKARKDCAYEITDTHLQMAKRIWSERARSAPPGLKLADDLGAAVRGAPEHVVWKKVKVAIYRDDLSPEGKKRARRDQRMDPALKEFGSYEDWRDALDAGDWILDFWLKRNGKADFLGYWRVPDPKIENELLTYVKQEPTVTLSGFGALKLSSNDLTDLIAEASAIAANNNVSNPASAMVPIRDAIAFIDERKKENSPPDISGFEGAMRDIFAEASKVGYKPTEFLRMIDREGGLATAKRLIMSSTPSSGFTRLWELQRLDLTVEALALREPWHRLFSEIELERARQRLKKLRYKFDA